MCSVLYITYRPMSTPTLKLPQARRNGLREQARSSIRTAIVTGEISPGETYTIGELAGKLAVSATPVREAILDLANEGLVEVIPNRGFRVPELSDQDLDELFQLRLLLEGGALESLASSITTSQLNEFRNQANVTIASAAAGDLPAFLAADRDFHLGLLEAMGNHRLVELVGRLRDQTRLYGLPALALQGNLGSAANEHLEILEALGTKQVDRIRRATTNHLRHTRGLWAGQSEP